MVTRFDHIVIAVRDLDSAIQRYQRLGFAVTPGGRHTGRGTHNAIIRFGLDYIELLSVYDEAEARASGPRAQSIVDFLQERDELLLGYALATANIAEEAERFRGTTLFSGEPFAMQRARPDGQQFTWRLFVPGGVSWRKPWPFLIQWDLPDEQRLLIEPPGTHTNGVNAWVRIAVAVRDAASATNLYQHRLGLPLEGTAAISRLAAHSTTFSLGQKHIDLLTPDGPGLVQQTLAEIGEGPLELTFAVKDLAQTRAYLTQQGISFASDVAGPQTLLLSPPEPSGVYFIFTQQQ